MGGLTFQFADDIAIVFKSKDLKDGNESRVNEYISCKWCSKPNPMKTESYAFHLDNRQAKNKLKVEFDGV